MHSSDLMDIALIQSEIASGYINVERHPSAPLRILNYSNRTQFEWRWNEATMQCRGLIVDDNWNIIARPFKKFFSIEQLNGVVPAEPFEVYDKVDGSLGIVYFVNGIPHVATRGSFASDQAIHATNLLRKKYSHAKFDEDYTYLFEIVYPDNRIVVDYGDRDELVLLAIIETSTGNEWPLHAYDSVFPVVKRYDWAADFHELLKLQDISAEGFVVRFQSGQRVKIKFDEYKRLHKLLTGVSPRAIWEALRRGSDLSDVIEHVPDEFFKWVKDTERSLRSAFTAIESKAQSQMTYGGTRKELAQRFTSCEYPSVMFSMLDGKDYADQIWKMIRPSGKAFRCDIDM